ncbi:MAG: Gfo/Idh/MocA family oxidoreductase [Candidatus Omnitrophica bacterium]|nr:Gfo/Idh/MocA family oxidoreductase [Candidatus Omnitrophota bacterium]
MPAKIATALRTAVIGCGSIGLRHLRNLHRLGWDDLVVWDPQADRRAEARRACGARPAVSLADAVGGGAQVAFVTTPTALHLPAALEAARAGCHLFIEKPLSHTAEGLEELVEKVRRHQLITLVGCNMRFHHGPATIKRLLDEGAVGRVISASFDAGQYLPDWHPEQDYRQQYSARRALGGGVVLDGIHELDLARWFFGEVAEAFAYGGHRSSLEIDVEDTADILLKFQRGASATVHLDYVQRVYGRRCKVIGEQGTILWDMTEGSVRLYTASTRGWQEFPPPAGYTVNDMYVAELQHFLRCLEGTEQPMQDLHEARQALHLALAVQSSLDTGSAVRP